jgi:hypothetical protein
MTRSNAPTIDLTTALDPAQLYSWIEFNYEDHALVIAGLLERFAAFNNVTAGGIADDFIAGHAADFARDLKMAASALDETRTRIKKPVLHAQRMIDGEAKKLTDRVTAAVAEVEARVTAYLRVKEAEARKAAEIEAQRLAEEARKAIAQAQQTNTTEAIDAAVDALNRSMNAEETAIAPTLELTRTRGVGGALTALKDAWVSELVDITQVPTAYLQVNDAVVKAAIKSGVRDIPGLRIWNDAKAFVR